MLKLIIFVLNYLTVLFYTKTIIHLKACLHGGGGPQLSEVRDGPLEKVKYKKKKFAQRKIKWKEFLQAI